ncbi:MAG: hypothetical protein FWG65_07405 [Turicibacter sp.]|nr:hypothetical protein [Turicibacter sp.]
MIITVVLGGLTAACFAVGILSLLHRIRLITNPWVYMSEEERERGLAEAGEQLAYRQQAVTFFLLTLVVGYSAAQQIFQDLPSGGFLVLLVIFLAYAWKSQRDLKKIGDLWGGRI